MAEKSGTAEGFEPKIMGFLCNWCSYAGADLAGVSRYQYPSNLRIIRIMCSTRLDPAIILEMFIQGADGVLIGGCHPGDCHYITGNYYTEKRVKITKMLLEKAGFDPRCLRLEWISASEGGRFADLVKEFTAEIRELGPSPLSVDDPDVALLEKLHVARNAINDFTLRLLVNKEIELTEKGNVYGKIISKEEFDRLLEETLEHEFALHNILQQLTDESLTVPEISKRIGLSPQKVLQHVVTLRDRGLIRLDKTEGDFPFYTVEKGVV